jgi:hypothetical protein
MSAAWPRLIERLLELLPTLPGWSDVAVYDGPPVTAEAPTDYCTIGYVVGEDFGGTYEQARNAEGGWAGALQENGSIRSEIVCTTGDVDLPAVRNRAFALADAWEAEISRDETLGVLGASSTVSLSVDVQPAQTTSGSEQRLAVTVSYLSRSV